MKQIPTFFQIDSLQKPYGENVFSFCQNFNITHNEQTYTRIGQIYNEIDPNQQGSMAQILVSTGKKEVKYSRSYKKYDLISAEVTGVMGVLAVFLKFLILPYFDKGYFADLVENSFEISFDKPIKKKLNLPELIKQQNKRQEQENLETVQVKLSGENSFYDNNNKILGEIDKQQQNVYPIDQQQSYDIGVDINEQPIQSVPHLRSQHGGSKRKIKSKIKLKENSQNTHFPKKLSIGFFEWITCLARCQKKSKLKRKILDVGIAKVKKELDILTILQKLKEIDRLKYCILNHDQLTLFNNLPKPKLTPESTENDDDPLKMMYQMLVKDLSEEAKQEYINKTYQKMKSREQKSELDQNILSSFKRAIRMAQ